MNFCLYRLRFLTPVHVGAEAGASKAALSSGEMTIHADTLFSALCVEAGRAGCLGELVSRAKEGRLLLSDLLPYNESDEEYYLPKPVVKIELALSDEAAGAKKEFKKLKFVPASKFGDYVAYLRGRGKFDVGEANRRFRPGVPGVRACAAIKEETEPYHVGIFVFAKGWGLYLIAGFGGEDERRLLERLLDALSHSGIGGKRTAGLGKFELDDVIFLDDPYSESLEAISRMLGDSAAPYQMTLGVSLPRDDELDAAAGRGFFTVVRRAGFVQSAAYAPKPLKKKEMYVFGPGSCFEERYSGDVFDVSAGGGHPVYRYLKPVFAGVRP